MIHPASCEELEAKLIGDGDENRSTRERALWNGARLDLVERHVGGGRQRAPGAGRRSTVRRHRAHARVRAEVAPQRARDRHRRAAHRRVANRPPHDRAARRQRHRDLELRAVTASHPVDATRTCRRWRGSDRRLSRLPSARRIVPNERGRRATPACRGSAARTAQVPGDRKAPPDRMKTGATSQWTSSGDQGTAEAPGTNVRAKAGINRVVFGTGWGAVEQMLRYNAPAVVLVALHHTSQTRHARGHVDASSRVSEARFRCTACGHRDHADLNAARNIRRWGLAQHGEERFAIRRTPATREMDRRRAA